MKSITIFKIAFFLLFNSIFGLSLLAQYDGPAGLSGYLEDSTDFWGNTPQLVLSPESQNFQLPPEVNNSNYFYFPRKDENGVIKKFVYEQKGTNSCAAVSTLFYTFAYEINRVRGVPPIISIGMP